MEEADQLAHRLCIIDNGKIVAEGEPGKLKGQIGADMIKLVVKNGEDPNIIIRTLDAVRQLPGVKEVQDCTKGGIDCSDGVVIYSADGSNLVPLIVRSLDLQHIEIENLVLAKPSLDDVFIKFTGKQLRTDLQKVPPKAGFRHRRR
jgi:ABC-2 type transport system ATP-binding protein